MNWTHVAIVGWGLAVPTIVGAQDFRVETDVFVGKKKEPAAQYLTIFKGPFVYDFLLDGPREVTIYDVQRGRFILLDPSRGVQTTVMNDELLKLTADLKVQALSANNRDVQFLANPQFDVKFDERSRSIELFSKKLTYSAKGLAPDDASVVRRYTNFADGYARLNGLRLGNLPPFARLQLNEQLAVRGWVPEEVTRIVGESTVRSRHLFSWRVLTTDEKKTNEADNQLQTLKAISLPEYLAMPERVAKAQ